MFPHAAFPESAFPAPAFPPLVLLVELEPGGGDSRRRWLLVRAQIIQEDAEFIEVLATLIENDVIH